MDKDGSGAISPDEIKKALGIDDDQDETLDKLIKEIDENGDGEIQFEEFCKMMNKLTVWERPKEKWTRKNPY